MPGILAAASRSKQQVSVRARHARGRAGSSSGSGGSSEQMEERKKLCSCLSAHVQAVAIRCIHRSLCTPHLLSAVCHSTSLSSSSLTPSTLFTLRAHPSCVGRCAVQRGRQPGSTTATQDEPQWLSTACRSSLPPHPRTPRVASRQLTAARRLSSLFACSVSPACARSGPTSRTSARPTAQIPSSYRGKGVKGMVLPFLQEAKRDCCCSRPPPPPADCCIACCASLPPHYTFPQHHITAAAKPAPLSLLSAPSTADHIAFKSSTFRFCGRAQLCRPPRRRPSRPCCPFYAAAAVAYTSDPSPPPPPTSRRQTEHKGQNLTLSAAAAVAVAAGPGESGRGVRRREDAPCAQADTSSSSRPTGDRLASNSCHRSLRATSCSVKPATRTPRRFRMPG
jgi:hypothetical protein